jgi:predicted enzyme related to lactoylglutathione lyase
MQLSHLVLRAAEPERLVPFYEAIGLAFRKERHGDGPEHVCAQLGTGVFEIYPLGEGQPQTTSVRLGFAVADLLAACRAAVSADGEMIGRPQSTSWGRRAVMRDPAGHIVDLVQA